MAQSVKVYFAPFEARFTPLGDFQVRGLLLLPVYQHTGQFRRIGIFDVEESWKEEEEEEEFAIRYPYLGLRAHLVSSVSAAFTSSSANFNLLLLYAVTIL